MNKIVTWLKGLFCKETVEIGVLAPVKKHWNIEVMEDGVEKVISLNLTLAGLVITINALRESGVTVLSASHIAEAPTVKAPSYSDILKRAE